MRVCIVTVAGYVHGIGGMQDHTVDLIRGLVAAGHEVDAIAPRHPDGLASSEYAGAVWHFVDAPIMRQRLPIRHPAWHRKSAELFAQLHDRRRFDVVHSESASALGLLHRGWHRRVPVVVKFHGNYLTFMRTYMARILARDRVATELKGMVWLSILHFLTRANWYAFRPCEAMVPSRAQLADTIRSQLLQPSRAHVVPNGIDTTVFAPGDRNQARAKLGLGNETVFIWLGRMYPGKGVEVAIDALARVDESVSLLLVGDGDGRPALEARAINAGVATRVRFVGMQPRELIPGYLRAADALVFPSLLPEAAPLTPLQAMSCELPVVASRIGALPELIDRPGANGLLVEPHDSTGLAEAMATLAADEQLRMRLGAAARERVLAEYTLDRMVERTLDVYRLGRARLHEMR